MSKDTIDYRNVFESMPVIGMVVDTSWRMVAVTKCWEQHTNRTIGDVAGQNVLEVFPNNPNDPDSTSNAVFQQFLERTVAEKAFLTKPVQQYDIEIPGEGWVEKHYTPLFTPVIDLKGEVTHVIHVVIDVTDSVVSSR